MAIATQGWVLENWRLIPETREPVLRRVILIRIFGGGEENW